jgi:PLP dependent protein
MNQQNNIAERFKKIKAALPDHVKLIAISKTHTVDVLFEAYQSGQRIFGENKVQELVPKYEALPKDIEWHMVGHMQTNKVKYLAPFISYIHSVDSYKLLETIDKEAAKNNRIIKCMLEVHIASEESKFGLKTDEVLQILSEEKFKNFKNISIVGLMGMATFTDHPEKIRLEFRSLAQLFKTIKTQFFIADPSFKEISMGMSDDYTIAIEEGSTMVRIGTLIFGKRIYNQE